MVESYSKLDIANQYLDAAMQMYLEHRNYFCAIHLAGAAAELFDRQLPQGMSTYEIAWRAQRALHRVETNKDATNEEIKRVINGTKNAIKHMNDGEPKVTIDPIFEAKRHIDDAVVSSEKLGLEKTPTAWRYQDYRNTEMHSNRV
jgi:hypothetical protein